MEELRKECLSTDQVTENYARDLKEAMRKETSRKIRKYCLVVTLVLLAIVIFA